MEPMEAGNTLEQRLFQIATEKRSPIYGVLELLPLCNLNCDMCYVRLDRKEMEAKGRLLKIEEWLALAEEMKNAGTLFLLLTGGEPLLYPDFRRFYTELRKMGMILTINTNGTLIDEDWAEFFAKNKPRRINITLYGGSDRVYSDLCHNREGFEKAVNGISLLRKHGVDVKINGSLVKANVQDRMKIIEVGESMDVPVRIDTYMYPAVRERSRPFAQQSRLDPETAAGARVEILRREMGEETFHLYRKQTLETVKHTPPGEAQQGCMHCKAGKSSFVINWQGMLRPCVVMDKPERPVLEMGFQKAWKEVVEETEQIRTSSKCSQCKYRAVCNTCAAAALLEAGGYDEVPEYICRYTKETIELLQEETEKTEL